MEHYCLKMGGGGVGQVGGGGGVGQVGGGVGQVFGKGRFPILRLIFLR